MAAALAISLWVLASVLLGRFLAHAFGLASQCNLPLEIINAPPIWPDDIADLEEGWLHDSGFSCEGEGLTELDVRPARSTRYGQGKAIRF